MNLTRPLFSSLPTSKPLTNTSSISTLTHRLFSLPPIPASPSSSHSSLSSFLDYAARTSLPESTTTYQGTLYEYTVQKHLRTSAFLLHRVGGRSDLGVDLTGTWHVGSNPVTDPPVRVVVQCKGLKAKLGPNVVREVEGVAGRFIGPRSKSAGPEGGGGYAGVVVSPREATKGVREALGRSRMPLVWLMVGWDGVLRQALWNARVERLGGGLGGLGVETVYRAALGSGRASISDSASACGGNEQRQEVRLTWEGKEVKTMDEVEHGMERMTEEWMAKWDEEGLGNMSLEKILDAVAWVAPGMRSIMISKEEREMVAKALLST
ncbi:hypothetical protein BJX68DRAFT_266044 [Aspergillus pseudodeflectus]|uniref:Restriction endonuclease type IV Mrr domain-containing protein n=1 Tax=Aspergillus pseudodeflectus TaxID=176178 RepID=A0ABR4KHN7_9EURO